MGVKLRCPKCRSHNVKEKNWFEDQGFTQYCMRHCVDCDFYVSRRNNCSDDSSIKALQSFEETC